MVFRIRYVKRGAHYHGRVFQATAPGYTWASNGELVFDERGWEAFTALLHTRIEFVPEDESAAPSSEIAPRRQP